MFKINRRWARVTASAAILLSMFATGFAMGGGASDKEAPPDNTKKLKLLPLEENTKMYGWVRITPDVLSLGANHVKPDSYYTIYFVNGGEKQAVSKEPTVQASGAGEVKFSVRLTEPLGAKWSKLILFQHTDDKEAIVDGNLKPYMEASLR